MTLLILASQQVSTYPHSRQHRMMPPSKLSLGKPSLLLKQECLGNAPQKFVGYDIKPEKQIVCETLLHIINKYECLKGPLCASLLNQMDQMCTRTNEHNANVIMGVKFASLCLLQVHFSLSLKWAAIVMT